MPPYNRVYAGLAQFLTIGINMFGLLQANSSNDTIICEEYLFKNDVCSVCGFGSGEKLYDHEIPESFLMLRIENTIYPCREDMNDVTYNLLTQRGPLLLKHMKCSIRNIRLARIMQSRTINSYDVSRDLFFSQKDPKTIIDEEFTWISQIILSLKDSTCSSSNNGTVDGTQNIQPIANKLDWILQYLYTVLPDEFSALKQRLLLIVESFKPESSKEAMNSRETRNFFEFKLYCAEENAKFYQLTGTPTMELSYLFSLTDAYFLYPLMNTSVFRQIYSDASIVAFLCSEAFSDQNALTEPFDIFKTIFIAKIISEIKQSQELIAMRVLRLCETVQEQAKQCKPAPFFSCELLSEAEEYQKELCHTNPNYFLYEFSLNVTELARINMAVIKFLKYRPERQTKHASKLFSIVDFSCYSYQSVYNHRDAFSELLDTKFKRTNYTESLKFTIRSNMNYNLRPQDVLNILDEYLLEIRGDSTNPNCREGKIICWECALLTYTILYVLNFMMNNNLFLTTEDFTLFMRHPLVNSFRVNMAFTTALYIRY